MRAFIAIDLPKEIKGHLRAVQEKLKNSRADVKWVEPGNIHLTLKFLGEAEEEKIKAVIEVIENIAKDKKPFSVRLSELGAFPGLSSARVIWAGIDKGDTEVKEIAAQLEDDLSKIGFPKEDRPFSSHITIGRTRSSFNRQELVKILTGLQDTFKKDAPEFNADKVTLFKSTLTPKGPVYEALKEINLKTT
ncbi:MAG: RNA 2',3'-cyclic phosphodiesterase [Candidatus Omnitrophica bacterium]|nr:RNA 2',3'-cyclic phosphodiesterase [Candidatus Omnitrophota bacterium]